jgi:hypothetical protein
MTEIHKSQNEFFDITPDVHLIQSMGQKGYKFWQAISELIDNALDARIPGKSPLLLLIKFGPDNVQKKKWIEIRDEGRGMTYDELEKAMKLAYVRNRKDEKKLGKFGLGLKTAASSLGAKFTIKTKHYENKNDEVFTLIYDEAKFIKAGKWELKPNREVDKNFKHGTLIRIEEFDERGTSIYQNKVSRMIDMFSLQYGPYIEQGVLRIITDTLKKKGSEIVVKPYKYELVNDKREELNFSVRGKKVTGWVGFVKAGHTGLSKGFFGFNLFWRNRLVGLHKKIGFRPHAENWRLVGELHLDDFPITNDKRDFIWNHNDMTALVGEEKSDDEGSFDYRHGALFKELELTLDKFEKYKKERRAVAKKVKDAVETENIPMRIARELNHKLKTELVKPEEIEKELIININKLKKDGEIKNEILDNLKSFKSEVPKVIEEKEDIEKYDLTTPIFDLSITRDGNKEKYMFHHKTKSFGIQGSEFEIKRDGNNFIVITNTDHPLLSECEDLNFLYTLHKVEAIILKIIQLKDEKDTIENYFTRRDQVWREFIKQQRAKRTKLEIEKKQKELENEFSSEF